MRNCNMSSLLKKCLRIATASLKQFSSETTKTKAFFNRPTHDDVLIWLTGYETLHTGFPFATNTCQSTFRRWRGCGMAGVVQPLWAQTAISGKAMQKCFKLHVFWPFTFFGLKWTIFIHNIVFSECLHARFYVVAIFLSSHMWTTTTPIQRFSLILLHY